MKMNLGFVRLAVLLVVAFGGASETRGYSQYADPTDADPSNPTTWCAQCHDGFIGRGATHDLHVGNGQMTAECSLCHFQNGDNPFTYQSGATGGQGCRGCHGVNNGTQYGWGAGLRRHHDTNPNVTADSEGRRCVNCHTNDPAPSAESALPVYYSRTDVFVKNPCLATPSRPGEDFSGDGKGLDNNGNLIYDENENECGFRIVGVALESSNVRVTWQSVVGVTNFLQVTAGSGNGNFATNFANLGAALVTSGTVMTVTNRLDVGGATNNPARYYRIRRP